MLLTIDIGNTNINFGIFRNNEIIKKFSIPTKHYFFRKLKDSLGKVNVDDVIICSVVPKVCRALNEDLRKLLNKRPYVLSENIKAPIKNLYRKPKEVGQDRLVNACAGVMLYGAPLIVVDFGTAITFDVISRNKEYLGGMITPGLGISLIALNEYTALLPKIKLKKAKEFIGRDTINSMSSGIINGFAALADGLIIKIKTKLGNKAKVIGTGGDIALICRHCKQFNIIEEDLTLKGLNLIYNKAS